MKLKEKSKGKAGGAMYHSSSSESEDLPAELKMLKKERRMVQEELNSGGI